MGRSLRWSLCLLAALAAAALPRAAAVTCDSFKPTEADCGTKRTSQGKCGVVGGVCVPVAPLPPGMAAVTTIVEPPPAPFTTAESGAPAPVIEGRPTTRKMLAPPPSPPSPGQQQPECVDVPTPEGFTCAQQSSWGKCSEKWMTEGQWCCRTCGACPEPATAGAVEPSPAPTAEAVIATGSSLFCSMPAERGPCRAYIPSWYWDTAGSQCRPMVYGGCQGNNNRFESLEACVAAVTRWCGAQ